MSRFALEDPFDVESDGLDNIRLRDEIDELKHTLSLLVARQCLAERADHADEIYWGNAGDAAAVASAAPAEGKAPMASGLEA